MGRMFVRFSAPAAILFTLTLAACSKSDRSSPVAPSSFEATPAASSSSATGATISGTVLAGVGGLAGMRGASVRPQGATLTVSVVGTSINAPVDASGRFTLSNVPSGDPTLAFTGNGIDARLTITGVRAHDQIRITVTVNGNTADLDENDREMENQEAEVEGGVASTNCAANPRTIVVGTTTSTTVNIQNARIRHDGNTLTCAQIQVNDRVEAHGTKSGATLVATDVNVKTDHKVEEQPGSDDGDGENEDEDEPEVKGTVAGAAAGHACPAFTFAIGTTTVTTTATTRFEDTTCARVVNGITVEAKGTRTGPAAITAMKIEKK